MKFKLFVQCSLFTLILAATSGCQSSNNMVGPNDIFGTYDSMNLKMSELTPEENAALIKDQKQIYETAQRILENHYLDSWFANYEVKNKFATLDEAKKDYYQKNAIVSDKEVSQFIKENATNKELLKIPQSQQASVVRQYLFKVAQARAEQSILAEAYKQDKLKLVAYSKPQEQVVEILGGGHVFDPNLKNPKVTIVEFADYQCPFCVKANADITKFVSAYKGKVQYIFMDFPLLDKHPQALPAALAAKCAANQGKYWEMHSAIFDRAPMDELNTAKYTAFAQKLELDMNQFKDCQNDLAQKESIEADLNEGLRVGVNETPTIYINGQKFDDYITFDNLKSSVDKLLAK